LEFAPKVDVADLKAKRRPLAPELEAVLGSEALARAGIVGTQITAERAPGTRLLQVYQIGGTVACQSSAFSF
jgi:hypothetical protein